MNLSRYNLTLWKYSHATPAQKLYRHHRLFRRIAFTAMWAAAGAMSSLPLFLMTRHHSTVEILILGSLAMLGLILVVPSLFACICLSEIEKAMQSRRLSLPMKHPVDHYFNRHVLYLMFWAALVILLPAAIRYLLSLLR